MEGAEAVGVPGKEGQDDRGAAGEVHVNQETVADLVEEAGGIGDRLGPQLGGQVKGIGLGVGDEAADPLDFVIESGEADAAPVGFGVPNAVVLEFGKQREAVEILRNALRDFGCFRLE